MQLPPTCTKDRKLGEIKLLSARNPGGNSVPILVDYTPPPFLEVKHWEKKKKKG